MMKMPRNNNAEFSAQLVHLTVNCIISALQKVGFNNRLLRYTHYLNLHPLAIGSNETNGGCLQSAFPYEHPIGYILEANRMLVRKVFIGAEESG